MSDQKLLDELIKTLNLEKLEENLFRGQSEQTAWGRVFGGQVIGQALSATQETVDNSRKAHSLHAYFFKTWKN
jgi:acyl-CoA thioesterase-2